jgi:hypothetical protein
VSRELTRSAVFRTRLAQEQEGAGGRLEAATHFKQPRQCSGVLFYAATSARGRPVACRASNDLAAICAKQQTFNISYDSKMHWGQFSILFGVACFAGIALFVMYRKPHA